MIYNPITTVKSDLRATLTRKNIVNEGIPAIAKVVYAHN